jgi:uncharacterized protein YjbJ (UPF0337 family)
VKKFLQFLFAGHDVAPWLGDTCQPDAGILVPQLFSEPSANNKSICKVVGTLPAGSRCMADKERRGAAAPAMTGRIATMDEDRISGTARNVGGKIEEGVGRLTGDARTQIQGKLDQAAGAPRTSTARLPTPRAILLLLLTSGFAGPSKPSPIRRRW